MRVEGCGTCKSVPVSCSAAVRACVAWVLRSVMVFVAESSTEALSLGSAFQADTTGSSALMYVARSGSAATLVLVDVTIASSGCAYHDMSTNANQVIAMLCLPVMWIRPLSAAPAHVTQDAEHTEHSLTQVGC